MGDITKIGWTNHPDLDPGRTWNPWQGCTKVSPACANCYMFRDKKRYGQDPTTVVRSATKTFNRPLSKKWRTPALVFVCSWSDFFHTAADAWRSEAWGIIRRTPHLTYLILTKRPENIASRIPEDWGDGWPNVWMGVTVEDNRRLHRVDVLRGVPAARRFISNEPALERIDWSTPGRLDGVDWLITGGESGALADVRPWHDWWARDAILAGRLTGTSVFVKQRGRKTVTLDGDQKNISPSDLGDLPEAIRVRQWPQLSVVA